MGLRQEVLRHIYKAITPLAITASKRAKAGVFAGGLHGGIPFSCPTITSLGASYDDITPQHHATILLMPDTGADR